jgi:hypothetical protein
MYLLFKRILDGEPTLLRIRGGRLVGFTKDGFHVHSHEYPEYDLNYKYPTNTWALADVETDVPGTDGEPTGPLERDSDLFVVFATSPTLKSDSKGYEQWLKFTGATQEIMDPFYKEEMEAFE